MAALERMALTKTERSDELEFCVERQHGYLEPYLELLILPAGFWFYRIADSLWMQIVVAFVVVSAVAHTLARWLQVRSTTLRVSADELFAEGYLGKLFSTKTSIAIGDLSVLGYTFGNDGEESCLYAKHSLYRETILPGVSQDQARLILEAIAEKFPFLPVNTDVEDFSLSDLGFGGGNQPITLGLSETRKTDKDK